MYLPLYTALHIISECINFFRIFFLTILHITIFFFFYRHRYDYFIRLVDSPVYTN